MKPFQTLLTFDRNDSSLSLYTHILLIYMAVICLHAVELYFEIALADITGIRRVRGSLMNSW